MASIALGSVVEFVYPSGSTVYTIIRKPADATVWQTTTSTFVAWNNANIANYDVALADGSGDYYSVTFPAGIAAGTYGASVYLQAGGTPAITDIILGSDSMASSGYPSVDVVEIEATDATTYIETRTLASADYTIVGDTIAGVTTVTNLTNAPTAGDLTVTMKASVNTEADSALTDYDGPTDTEMIARTLVSADYVVVGDTIAGVTLVATTTTNTDVTALSTEVGKIPKSDGTSTWNATALAAIQSESNDALVAYDPPTDTEMIARTLATADYFIFGSDDVNNVTLVDVTTTNTDMRGTDSANTVVPPSVSQFNARTLATADYFIFGSDDVNNVTLVDVTTTNTDMRGTDSANTVVPPSVSQFNARTMPTADYFIFGSDDVNNVTLVDTSTVVTTKTGYSLASTGLDLIPTTAPSGVATTWPARQDQLWRRFFMKVGISGTTLTTYGNDGTTAVTTQTMSPTTTTVQVQGASN